MPVRIDRPHVIQHILQMHAIITAYWFKNGLWMHLGKDQQH